MTTDSVCTDPDQGRHLAAYELGLLESDERLGFERHLGVCPACLEHLYEMATHSTAMRSEPGTVASRLREVTSVVATPGPVGSVAPTHRARRWAEVIRGLVRWRVLAPATAALALALLVLVQMRGLGPDDVARLARLEPVPYVSIDVRGGTPSGRMRLFEEGMSSYAAGRYDSAARLLTQALASAAEDPAWEERDQARFFLGLSVLLDGNPDSARVHLEAAKGSATPVIADRSLWYLAQAHLLLNDASGALRYLDALATSSPGYAERATRLREEILRVRRF
jgi:tetratricopeptide (TPR) repeat protein